MKCYWDYILGLCILVQLSKLIASVATKFRKLGKGKVSEIRVIKSTSKICDSTIRRIRGMIKWVNEHLFTFVVEILKSLSSI